MASPALPAVAQGPDDYARVYQRLLGQAREKVILHWVLPESDPRLTGYWGYTEWDKALEAFLAVVDDNVDKIDGVKVWPLGRDQEIELRRRVPAGCPRLQRRHHRLPRADSR